MQSADERVALLAADKVMERAWGKPQEVPEDLDDTKSMPPAERKRRVMELLAYAASLKVPEDHEANALDQDDEAKDG